MARKKPEVNCTSQCNKECSNPRGYAIVPKNFEYATPTDCDNIIQNVWANMYFDTDNWDYSLTLKLVEKDYLVVTTELTEY